MINALQSLYHKNNKNEATNNIHFFINNFMNKIVGQKKMIAKICQEGIQISQNDYLNGNMSEYDENILRQLTLQIYNDCLVLQMNVLFVKPHQEILSFEKKIDTINNYLLSNLNINSQIFGFVFYSHLDQIMAKYNIYLPKANDLISLSIKELDNLLFNIEKINQTMENSIMFYKDQLFSSLDLDQQSIIMHFQNHISLYNDYINDNYQIKIDSTLTSECIRARECEIFQGQILIEGGQQKNIQDLSETDQELINNCNNPILKKLNYENKIYRIEDKVDPINQKKNNNYLRQILEGELLQEFCRDLNHKEYSIQIEETYSSIQIPQFDQRQKNILQEQLPDIDISVMRKLLILKEAMFTINENERILKNPNFKGKLSIVKMIRFCNVLGARPIFIMQKKDKKSIDVKVNRENNNQIIQNLIYVLFYQDKYDEEIKPIDALCNEFLINLCNYELQDFPDIDKLLLKLEKLILLVKSIYCVPL